MKRVVFLIALVIMVLSIDYLGNTIIEYFKSNSSLTYNIKINDNNEKINKNKRIIEEKKKEVSEVETNNEDKVRLLEVWEKELGKVKKDS